MKTKATEREHVDAQRNISLLKRYNIEGRCFLDGGANVGLVSIAALEYFKRVVTVEAHPQTYAALRKNLAKRPAAFLCRAIAARSGETYFVSTPKNSTGATARPTMRLRGALRYYKEVKTISLDDLIKEYKPDCIKLDIEGSEYEALEASHLSGVKWLVIEFHGVRSELGFARFLSASRRLKKLGFKRLHPKTIPMLTKSAAKSFFFQTVWRKA